MAVGVCGDQLLCDVEPLRVIGTLGQHRPVAAPQHTLRAEACEQMRDIRCQRLHAGAARCFGEQAGEFAVHIGMLGQRGHAGGPGDEFACGDLRLAAVIDDHAQLRMALQACLQRRHMHAADQGVEGQVVREQGVEGSIQFGLGQPLHIGDVLHHRAQALEHAAAGLHQCVDARGGVRRGEIDPTDHAGNTRIGARQLEQVTGLGLGRGRLHHHHALHIGSVQRLADIGGAEVAI